MHSRIQPLLPGDPRRIGTQRVIGRLGSGGMGTVYAAVDPTGLRLTVKVIHPAHAANEEFRARFRREVRLSQRVTGPCLVPVHDADTDHATPWLSAPFVPGPTLAQYLDAHGPVQDAPLYALATGTAAALAAVHEAGIVHRDIKPGNVILSPSGPKLLDFGISHVLDGTSVTRTGVLTGTPGWISPEHYQTGEVGPEGDIFAWGALVAYAATGRLPFGTGAPDALAFRVMSAEPDLSGLPGDLLSVVKQALAKRPGDRPTGRELSRACSLLLADQAAAAVPAGQQTMLVRDLVGVPWKVAHEDDPAWQSATFRRKRLGIVAAAAGAALVAGSIGGAVAVKAASTPNQVPAAAPSDSLAPARTVAPVAQSPAGEVRRPSTSPTPVTAAAPSAPAEEPEPSSPPSLQPPPFTYMPAEVDCTPRKQAEVEGAWQFVAPGEVRSGDAVELTLRNKYGNFAPVQPEMDVLARVYVPDGTSRLARTSLHSDTSAVVTWPGDFSGADAFYVPGTYTVVSLPS